MADPTLGSKITVALDPSDRQRIDELLGRGRITTSVDTFHTMQEKVDHILHKQREREQWNQAREQALAILSSERRAAESSVPVYQPLAESSDPQELLTSSLIYLHGAGITYRVLAGRLIEAGWHL